MSCPACHGETKASRLAELTVDQCHTCGHRTVSGFKVDQQNPKDQSTTEKQDLHEEYEQGEYLSSLIATRERQAQMISNFVRTLAGSPEQVAHASRSVSAIDFGSGRGTMTGELVQSGLYSQVYAVDNSTVALKLGSQHGAAELMPRSPYPNSLAPLYEAKSDRFDLFALDVIEHFASQDIARDLLTLAQVRRIRFLVIKVPCADGPLHRLATLLATLGATGPLRRLFLADSGFPHRQVFTEKSLSAVLTRMELTAIEVVRDHDFEPRKFAARVGWLSPKVNTLAHPLLRALGTAIGYTLAISGKADSMIVIAAHRPQSNNQTV